MKPIIEQFLNDIVTMEASEFTNKYCNLIPYWNEIVGFNQNNPAHYATLDLHIIDAMNFAPKHLVTKLALLFHDHGKLLTKTTDEQGISHFYNHAKKSAEIFLDFAMEHNIPIILAQDVLTLIKHHTDYNIRPIKAFNIMGDLAIHLGMLMQADKKAHNITKHGDHINKQWFDDVNKLCAPKNNALDQLVPTMIIMIGLPKTGKSFFVNKYDEFETISRDVIREELGGTKNYFKEEDRVTEIFTEKLTGALKQKKNIIIDNTNLKKGYRDNFAAQGRKHSYNIIFITPHVDYHTLLERAKAEDFPISVLKNMALSYVPLQLCEYI